MKIERPIRQLHRLSTRRAPSLTHHPQIARPTAFTLKHKIFPVARPIPATLPRLRIPSRQHFLQPCSINLHFPQLRRRRLRIKNRKSHPRTIRRYSRPRRRAASPRQKSHLTPVRLRLHHRIAIHINNVLSIRRPPAIRRLHIPHAPQTPLRHRLDPQVDSMLRRRAQQQLRSVRRQVIYRRHRQPHVNFRRLASRRCHLRNKTPARRRLLKINARPIRRQRRVRALRPSVMRNRGRTHHHRPLTPLPPQHHRRNPGNHQHQQSRREPIFPPPHTPHTPCSRLAHTRIEHTRIPQFLLARLARRWRPQFIHRRHPRSACRNFRNARRPRHRRPRHKRARRCSHASVPHHSAHLRDKPVSPFRQRLHISRRLHLIAQRRPYLTYAKINSPLKFHIRIRAPQPVAYLFARHGLPSPLHQLAQHSKRLRVQLHRCAAFAQLSAARV